MGNGVRLAFVAVFFGAIAWVGTRARLPPAVVIGGLGVLAGGLVLISLLDGYFKRRAREGAATLTSPARLHRPNELVAAAVLGHAQWVLLAASAAALVLGIAFPARDRFAAAFVLLLVALGAKYLRDLLLRGIGAWTTARLRLIAITHRCVEFAIVADPEVGSAPIRVQASYSRNLGVGTNRTRSELLWRSPTMSADAQRLPDGVEFRARLAMPDDFPLELEIGGPGWQRSWTITVQVSQSRFFNFNFAVPPASVAGAL